jgi:RNA polymerase sigma factor (TIGR02999 family)
MNPSPEDRITAILLEAEGREGAPPPLDALLPALYDELRAMARGRLRHERADLTLSPTELVHEAYLRLADATRITDRGRAYFFAAAARAMRRIVVEHARRRGRIKRGGGRVAITLDEELALPVGAEVEVLDLDEALDRLADINPRAARVVECRFYGGLGVEETAVALDVTPRTVNRDWAFARAWLFDHLKAAGDGRP